MDRIATPFIFTIFGASGDLAQLKLFPALYDLALQRRLPKEYYIVGFARTKKSRKEFQKDFEKSVKKYAGKDLNKKILKGIIDNLYYFSGQYNNGSDYKKYCDYLEEISNCTTLPHLVYFAVPPVAFKDIIKNLGEHKRRKNDDIRIILEKPFGDNAETARKLYHYVAQYFEDDQVYLLDHYLGKTGVQTILNIRHANRFLNLIMKGPEVSNIQITAFENTGVENRVGYFDQVGTFKDMIQSHLLQVLSLIAMSIPISNKAESLHREKYSILNALKFIKSPKNISLGQYEGYQNIKGVKKNSKTETFAALRLFIDRQSWFKVPIYIRTGKKLNEKHTYVVIELEKFDFQDKDEPPNRIIIDIYPNERISIKLANKVGRRSMYQDITTSDSIACTGDDCLPPHGTLLLDVMCKKKMYFLSFPEIIATWELTDQIVDYMKKQRIKVEKYKPGSDGPKSQYTITERDGYEWYDIHKK